MSNNTTQSDFDLDTLAADCGDIAVEVRTLADDAQAAAEYVEWLADRERNESDFYEKEFDDMNLR